MRGLRSEVTHSWRKKKVHVCSLPRSKLASSSLPSSDWVWVGVGMGFETVTRLGGCRTPSLWRMRLVESAEGRTQPYLHRES